MDVIVHSHNVLFASSTPAPTPTLSPVILPNTQNYPIQELEKRVTELEKSLSFQATQNAIKEEQMKMLTTLRNIREAMVNNNSSSGLNAMNAKEIEALKKENDDLKKKLEKKDYRIKHLVRAVEELQS